MKIRSWLAHLFVPHTSNNHKPKVLHIDALFLYVLLLIAYYVGIQALHGKYPNVLGFATDIHVEQLLAATNQKRKEAGLGELTLNSQLSAAAANKAVDMFSSGYWAHTSPTGKVPWDFIVAAGYRYSVAGENLAKNFSTSQSVVDAWMASQTHRDNILKPGYRDIGFAVVNGELNGEETTLVVQMFGAAATGVSDISQTRPVEISEAVAVEKQPVTVPELASHQAVQTFSSVIKQPIVHIPTLTKDVSFVLLGVLAAVLAVDAWLVAHRRVVRLSGHSIAHGLFFTAITVALTMVGRGSLL